MVVTVRHLENNIWNAFQCDNTVSSAPVVRLRDQERCDPSVLSGNSMEARGTNHPNTNQKVEINPTTWPNDTEEKVKKEKKWSIGKLFRRKKKETESDSSTEESSHKSDKRKKSDNKQRLSQIKHQTDQRSQSVTKFTKKEYFDEGVLSDPSAGFVGYTGRGLPRSPYDRSNRTSRESLDKRGGAESGCGSQDGSLRKGRKGRLKARVEAIRNMKHESSSDEESQKSTSSSIHRFRSDDSLVNHSKSDLVNKRSRSARTDRYLKRLSRDDESQNDKDSEILNRLLNKADSESFSSRQRILSSPQVNGVLHDLEYGDPQIQLRSVSNIPERSYSGTNITQMRSHPIPFQSNSKTSTLKGSNSSVYSYPVGVINFNAKVNDENVTYSVPYSNKRYTIETNHNTRPSFARSTSIENNNVINDQNNETDNVMVVKFPLGNVHPVKKENPPPMPPPRDPQRKIPTPLSYMYENTRPQSQNFDSSAHKNIYARIGESRSNVATPNNFNMQQNLYENTMSSNQSNGLSWMKRPISTSEDHIAMQQSFANSSKGNYQNEQPRRPSSVTAEVIRPEIYNRYLMRPQINNENPRTRHTQDIQNQDYLYFADKMPRSRKPIHITPNSLNVDGKNANVNTVAAQNIQPKPRSASEFWRKMDNQETQRKKQLGHNRTLSDQSVNNIFINNQSYQRRPQTLSYTNNNPIKSQIYNGNLERRSDTRITLTDKPVKVTKTVDEPVCYSNIDILPMKDVRKESLKNQSSKSSDEDLTKSRRKSTNLEDALSELEAIYNSLGLGDEDLLERAEKRELMTPKTTESYPHSASMKDSYFRYPSFSSDMPKPNHMNRRSSIPDKLHDDMAYRRMNPHERPKSKDVNNLVTQVSYMLTSPVSETSDNVFKYPMDTAKSEPDVVYDDVVYRNLRQANNYLKIEDPQPLFGIPIGPITAAPHSDYLHANASLKEKPAVDVPDIVTDDLAYRTLRKDRTSVTSIEDVELNKGTKVPPSTIFDNHVTKKKRAVRSLSANIFTLIQKEIDDALGLYNGRSGDKAQSIPDLPEAVVEFGKSGKLPDDSISKEKSDTVLKVNDRISGRPPLAVTPEKSPRSSTPVGKMPYSPKRDIDDYFSNSYGSKSLDRNNPFKTDQNEDDTPYKFENKFHSDIYLNNKNKIAMDSSVVLYSQVPKTIHIERRTNINNEVFNHKSVYENVGKNKEKADNESESKGKSTEDSLLEISNQLRKVEDKIKSNIEFQSNFDEEGVKFKALAKKCDASLNENFKSPYSVSNATYKPVETVENKYVPLETKQSYVPSETKQSYVPLETKQSYVPLETKQSYVPSETKHTISEPSQSTSIKMSEPIKISNEKSILTSHISSVNEDLDKMPSFDDLRKGINDLLDGISHVTDKFNLRRANELKDNKVFNNERKESPIELSTTEDEKSKDNRGSPEYNSSEELAMIFNLNKEDTVASSSKAVSENSHMELNSPKLVNTANQTYKKDLAVPEPSKPSSSIQNDAPWRKQREQPIDNGSKGTYDDDMSPCKTNAWYQDTDFLMLACFYALAYTQQLAGLDILTLLGLILATISIIAMLII